MMAARTKRRTDAKTLLGSATMNTARTERSIDVNLMKIESDGGDNSNGKRDKERRKFDNAVSLVKSAAKEVWNENAENQKSLRAIISILKEQESTDGGAKIAVANRAPSLLVDMLPINVKPHYA